MGSGQRGSYALVYGWHAYSFQHVTVTTLLGICGV